MKVKTPDSMSLKGLPQAAKPGNMAFSIRSVLGFSAVLGAFVALGCDDGGGTVTPVGGTGGGAATGGSGNGNTGGSGNTTTGGSGNATGGSGTAEGTVVFDGMGTWVDGAGPAAAYGMQGAFFVLEDSVKDGTPVPADGLTHTDLTPDEFDDTTVKPCVTGTVAQVTAAAGAECDPAGTDCEWSALWGGGIGLNLNETGGEESVKSPLDLTAAGVKGFGFTLSGDVSDAVIRFKVKDQTNGEADFCTEVVIGANTVMLADLVHNCYAGGVASEMPDFTKALQVEWQIVPTADSTHPVADFCIESVTVVSE